jgi:hypothetical protein
MKVGDIVYCKQEILGFKKNERGFISSFCIRSKQPDNIRIYKCNHQYWLECDKNSFNIHFIELKKERKNKLNKLKNGF